MKQETKIILLLVFLSPVLGELLSGSSPPFEFFTWFGLFIMVSFYGGSTLLIREARARWKLQWSVIFLAIAYGILEEGIMVQSFFNMNHVDLGALSGYGMYGGVQWPWTLSLIVYHASISTLIPIAMVDLLWPTYQNTSLLKKRGIVFTSLLVGLVTVLMITIIWSSQKQYTNPYIPNPVLLGGSCIVIALLILLSYRFRTSTIHQVKMRLRSPWTFAVAGFIIQFVNFATMGTFAQNHVFAPITILIECLFIGLVILFMVNQFLHKERTNHHVSSFIIGSIFFWILLTIPQEFINHATGMIVVGVISFIALFLWRRKVLKIDEKKLEKTPSLSE